MTDTRTCARCSHLRSEHKHVAYLDPVDIEVYSAVGYCYCCDCPFFVAEPLMASGSPSGEPTR